MSYLHKGIKGHYILSDNEHFWPNLNYASCHYLTIDAAIQNAESNHKFVGKIEFKIPTDECGVTLEQSFRVVDIQQINRDQVTHEVSCEALKVCDINIAKDNYDGCIGRYSLELKVDAQLFFIKANVKLGWYETTIITEKPPRWRQSNISNNVNMRPICRSSKNNVKVDYIGGIIGITCGSESEAKELSVKIDNAIFKAIPEFKEPTAKIVYEDLKKDNCTIDGLDPELKVMLGNWRGAGEVLAWISRSGEYMMVPYPTLTNASRAALDNVDIIQKKLTDDIYSAILKQ